MERIGLVGVTGYTGMELIRVLASPGHVPNPGHFPQRSRAEFFDNLLASANFMLGFEESAELPFVP